ncbi:MAG: DNA-directed RNA polymerase subunit D [Methanobrevibacter sp.]|jgi:DNA-directed RNA polymerase subunit D|nr:DNA-directed RNA polymerase subunit D [Candidatus Methanovirga aequatorialis]
MEIEVKEKNDNEMVFILDDVDVAFANAIRRIGMMEVPKIAIEYVNIIKNDSVMFNEVLAHRLGLIPIVSDIEAIESLIPNEECDCKDDAGNTDGYCSKCSVSFTLTKNTPGVVYSGDLNSNDPKIKPVYDMIPILKLKEDQEVELEAVAIVGRGKDHAKWMPTTVCTYKQYPVITFNDEKELSNDVVEVCPNDILKLNKNTKKPEVQNIENCTLCRSCVRASENDAIDVGYEKNKIIFKIETDGSMTPKEVLLKACDVLNSKADKFIEFF